MSLVLEPALECLPRSFYQSRVDHQPRYPSYPCYAKMMVRLGTMASLEAPTQFAPSAIQGRGAVHDNSGRSPNFHPGFAAVKYILCP